MAKFKIYEFENDTALVAQVDTWVDVSNKSTQVMNLNIILVAMFVKISFGLSC